MSLSRLSFLLIVPAFVLGLIVVPSRAAAPHAAAAEAAVLVAPNSPLHVSLTAAPMQNGRATVTVQVMSDIDIDDVRLVLSVPRGIQVLSSSLPARIALASNQPRIYTLVLAGKQSRPSRIEVSAQAATPSGGVGGLGVLFLASRNDRLEAVSEDQINAQERLADSTSTVLDEAGSRDSTNPQLRSGTGAISPRDQPSGTAATSTVTAHGIFDYLDHAVTTAGIAATGTATRLRRAQVEIQFFSTSTSTWMRAGLGHTDTAGAFSFQISGVTIGTTKLRAQLCTIGGVNDKIRVVNSSAGGSPAYCYTSGALTAQADTDFHTTRVADSDAQGGPANIYATTLTAYEYVTAVATEPADVLTVKWFLGNAPACGSCYSGNTIDLNGTSNASSGANGDQWDDAVIAHEFGHWVMDKYAALPPNSGGSHGSCAEGNVRPNLEYSEGWATFYSSAARGNNTYIDTGGGINGTSKSVRLNHNLESESALDTTTPVAQRPTRGGNFCEWQISATLWDVLDANADVTGGITDNLQRPFANIFTAFRTTYNGHFPYNINQWWYGWVNTLANRAGGVSLGVEQAMLDNFTAHSTTVGVKMKLEWQATPPDLDAHLWLPPANPYEVCWGQMGSKTAFPYANLDTDHQTGFGPETIWMVSPYVGTYVYAAADITDYNDNTKGIAGTGAKLTVDDGSQTSVSTYTVPASGTGDLWYVLSMDGATGVITVRNLVQDKTTFSFPYRTTNCGSTVLVSDSAPAKVK